jgi:hypothetical protein
MELAAQDTPNELENSTKTWAPAIYQVCFVYISRGEVATKGGGLGGGAYLLPFMLREVLGVDKNGLLGIALLNEP